MISERIHCKTCNYQSCPNATYLSHAPSAYWHSSMAMHLLGTAVQPGAETSGARLLSSELRGISRNQRTVSACLPSNQWRLFIKAWSCRQCGLKAGDIGLWLMRNALRVDFPSVWVSRDMPFTPLQVWDITTTFVRVKCWSVANIIDPYALSLNDWGTLRASIRTKVFVNWRVTCSKLSVSLSVHDRIRPLCEE